MTPEVVVFDLGKVLVDFDYSIAGRRIASRAALGAKAVKEFIDHSPLLFRYETGRMTRREFFEAVCEATGFHGTLDEFANFFADIFTEIPPMVRWHGRLSKQGIPTYIFSNTNDMAVEHIRRNFPFFSNFDGYIYSYEVRAMKPQREIYEALEKMAGVSGRDILYLDDRLENVQAGTQRNWQVIHQVTPDESLRLAAQLGLPV